jgi:hypothetical protein
LFAVAGSAGARNVDVRYFRLGIAARQNFVYVTVTVLALGHVVVAGGGGLSVNAMIVGGLLISVTSGADGLGWRGFVWERLDIRMAIYAAQGSPVDGRLKIRFVHMQTDLLPVLVFCQRGIAMTGQTFFVTHFRAFGSGLRRGRRHRRKQQSKYNNPTVTLHENPFTFSPPSRRRLD